MERPESIVRFERLYLAAIAVNALNTAIHWSYYQTLPQVRDANAVIGGWYLPTITIVGALVPVILWYFVARRGSVIAKWIVVVFAALGVFGAITGLAFGTYATTIAAALGLSGLALGLAAAWMLFRPDARMWLGESVEPVA